MTQTQLSELTTEKLLQLYRTIIVKRGTEFQQSYIALESCLLEAQRRDAEAAALRQRVTHKDALINQLTEIDMAALEDEIDRLRQQVTELTAQLPSQQIAVTVRAALEDARSRAANATWIMTNMQRDQAAQELLDALNWLRKLQRGEEGAE